MKIERNTKEPNDFEVHMTLGKLLAIYYIFQQHPEAGQVARDIFLAVERTLREEGELI